MQLTTITDETRLALANLADRATGVVTPSVRLGVTGLARAGKTVFIAALVHNLVHGGRLPLFKAYAAGRVAGARLEPQPDDAVPRFDYERHVRALVEERLWPDSTRQISELRLGFISMALATVAEAVRVKQQARVPLRQGASDRSAADVSSV